MEETKSIKLSYMQLRNQDFNPVLMSLLTQKMKFRMARKVLKLTRAISAEQKKCDEAFKPIAEKYLEQLKDENGNPAGLALKSDLTEEQKTEAAEALDEFGRIEVEIQKEKLTSFEMSNLELAPMDLIKIEALIED